MQEEEKKKSILKIDAAPVTPRKEDILLQAAGLFLPSYFMFDIRHALLHLNYIFKPWNLRVTKSWELNIHNTRPAIF